MWLRRKDSGKWTLPGGHFEEDETAVQAAVRELWEETGIEAAPSDLESLGYGKVGRYEIHSFLYVPDEIPVPHGDNDPDEEAADFLWFDEPPSKPHVPHEKNVTLVLMGLAQNEGIVDLSPTGKPLTKTVSMFEAHPELAAKHRQIENEWIDRKAQALFGIEPGALTEVQSASDDFAGAMRDQVDDALSDKSALSGADDSARKHLEAHKILRAPHKNLEQLKFQHQFAALHGMAPGHYASDDPDNSKDRLDLANELADVGTPRATKAALDSGVGRLALVRSRPNDEAMLGFFADKMNRSIGGGYDAENYDIVKRIMDSPTIDQDTKDNTLGKTLHSEVFVAEHYPNEGDFDDLFEKIGKPYLKTKLAHTPSLSPEVAFAHVQKGVSWSKLHPKFSEDQIRQLVPNGVHRLNETQQDALAQHDNTPLDFLTKFVNPPEPFERQDFNPHSIDWDGHSQPYKDYHEDLDALHDKISQHHATLKEDLESEDPETAQAARDEFYRESGSSIAKLHRRHADQIKYGEYRQTYDSIHRWQPDGFDDMEPADVVDELEKMRDEAQDAAQTERDDIVSQEADLWERDQDQEEQDHNNRQNDFGEDAIKYAAAHPKLTRDEILKRLPDFDEDHPARIGMMYNPNLTAEDLQNKKHDEHAQTALQYLDPDSHNSVKFGKKLKVPDVNTERLRQLRDKIEGMGGKVHQKQLPGLPPSLKPLLDAKGHITSQAIQTALDAVPTTEYWAGNSPEHKWDGVQRHSDEDSTVFHVNYTNDHVRQMKEAGVWNTFHRIQTMLTRPDITQHPLGPTTIGWVRHTGSDDGTHIDEVQSDLAQARLTSEFRQAGINIPEDHLTKIKGILFGKRKTGQDLLAETFLHHHRQDPANHGKAMHWPSHQIKQKQGANPPLDTYKRLPKDLGFSEGGKYGQLKTQTGSHHDAPTFTSKVTKHLREFTEQRSTKTDLALQFKLLSKALMR